MKMVNSRESKKNQLVFKRAKNSQEFINMCKNVWHLINVILYLGQKLALKR